MTTPAEDRYNRKFCEQLQQQLANVTIMLTKVIAEREVIREDYELLAKQHATALAELATLKGERG